jgi:hypothetical protein
MMEEHVEKLRELFATHPAWQKAAKYIRDGSSSRVLFSHVAGDFQLLRRGGQSLLVAGEAQDPDFALRFTPRAIDRLAAIESAEIADFAIELFNCTISDDPELQVGLRVVGGFPRLMLRGYVGLLFGGGPRLLAYGASRGIRNVSDLRKFLKQTKTTDPRWEAL